MVDRPNDEFGRRSFVNAQFQSERESSQSIGVALDGVSAAITVMNSIKAAITQAEQPGADAATIGTSLAQLGAQLNTIIQSSNFNGSDLLDGSQGASINITASYNDGQGAAASTVNSIGLTLTALTNSTAPASGGTSIPEARPPGPEFCKTPWRPARPTPPTSSRSAQQISQQQLWVRALPLPRLSPTPSAMRTLW